MLRRGITEALNRALDSSKVVVLEGARSVGKTTLSRDVAQLRGFPTVFDLADPADRAVLTQDPHRVLAASARPILIDEAQLAPEIPVAVKRLVDRYAEAGQVLLTGSSRIGRGALGGSDPLVGRAVRLRLVGFTQSELAGSPRDTLGELLVEDPADTVQPELTLTDLVDRLLIGGLPPVALGRRAAAGSPSPGLTSLDRGRVFEEYLQGVLHLSLAESRTDLGQLIRTFRHLGANPGQILNLSRAASELRLRADTVSRYVGLCETAFLLDLALAMRPKEHQTLTSHPRVFPSDVGLGAWCADASPERLLRQPALLGSLVEALVFNELHAQASWSTGGALRVLHWRDAKSKHEVDLVVAGPDGSVMPVEVKSASRVDVSDTRGIQAFAVQAGPMMRRGIVFYTGRTTIQLASNVWAVPVTTLWA